MLITYGVLVLSILSLWQSRYSYLWAYLFAISFIIGISMGVVTPIALGPTVVLAVTCYYLHRLFESKDNNKSKTILLVKTVIVVLFIATSIAIGFHQFPGFNNLRVFHNVLFSRDAIPFTLTLNYDKALIGLFFLAFSPRLIRHKRQWGTVLVYSLLTTSVLLVTILPFAMAIGYVRFNPKWTNLFFYWATANLFIACLSEEAFFRGFLQYYLMRVCNKIRHGQYISLIFISSLFGIVHFTGGMSYVLLAFFAGLGYGWVYLKTESIEASILTHFFFNSIHFLFFTYPRLSG